MTLRMTLLVVLGMALSSCATTGVFDARACPREKLYSKEEQERFLNDLPKAPKSIQGLVVDYGKLRDKARACRGAA